MIFKGEVKGVIDNQLILSINDFDVIDYFKNHTGQPLKFESKKWRNSRTLEQNALYWACVHEIGKALNVEADFVHLNFLKQTQKPTTIECKKESYASFMDLYRLCEIVGEDEESFILNCYKGTEHMDLEEFGYLLNVVIIEMKEIGIEPVSREMKGYLNEIL